MYTSHIITISFEMLDGDFLADHDPEELVESDFLTDCDTEFIHFSERMDSTERLVSLETCQPSSSHQVRI